MERINLTSPRQDWRTPGRWSWLRWWVRRLATL